jgi:4-hydroxybenzoate polyprenyltransferase
MIKRLNIYCKEMYPIIPRLFVGLVIFFEIYFIMLLNHGITDFHIQIQEAVGSFTVFAFLFMLRIADDFKDYETDLLLFPERPLPSGRVKKKDLAIFLSVLIAVTAVLNIVFMNNIPFFLFLFAYGAIMSLWFFQKSKIQKNLFLALVTHNPVMMVMNIYIISFACIKYGLPFFSLTNILVAFTLYFPALNWEVARKIRAPRDETDYVTYSKIFGYKKAAGFVLFITLADIITNILLVYRLNTIAVAVLILNVAWMTWEFIVFIKAPERFELIKKVERYTYITEAVMVLVVALYLLGVRI